MPLWRRKKKNEGPAAPSEYDMPVGAEFALTPKGVTLVGYMGPGKASIDIFGDMILQAIAGSDTKWVTLDDIEDKVVHPEVFDSARVRRRLSKVIERGLVQVR